MTYRYPNDGAIAESRSGLHIWWDGFWLLVLRTPIVRTRLVSYRRNPVRCRLFLTWNWRDAVCVHWEPVATALAQPARAGLFAK